MPIQQGAEQGNYALIFENPLQRVVRNVQRARLEVAQVAETRDGHQRLGKNIQVHDQILNERKTRFVPRVSYPVASVCNVTI